MQNMLCGKPDPKNSFSSQSLCHTNSNSYHNQSGEVGQSGGQSGFLARISNRFSKIVLNSTKSSGGSGSAEKESAKKDLQVAHSSDRAYKSSEAMDVQKPEVMETFFVSHGSPMLPLENTPATQFFKGLGNDIKQNPRAIVVVSAHWNTRELMVNSAAKHSTIHDFYGFPRELYQLRYDAPGAPEVAKRVQNLLQEAGFKSLDDPRRGLDHGAWIPLLLMYPKTDIPVIQLSLQPQKDGLHHFKVGRALAPLTKEGVLIIGSGTTTHNLRSLGSYETTPTWAKDFDTWLNDALVNNRFDEVIHYLEKGPYAQTAHPTPDHFLPLLVALGAAGADAKAKQVHHSWEHSIFSMACYAFTPAADS